MFVAVCILFDFYKLLTLGNRWKTLHYIVIKYLVYCIMGHLLFNQYRENKVLNKHKQAHKQKKMLTGNNSFSAILVVFCCYYCIEVPLSKANSICSSLFIEKYCERMIDICLIVLTYPLSDDYIVDPIYRDTKDPRSSVAI